MPEKDVVITYETLFELLRIEKNREDLQKINDSFFNDVLAYLNEKRERFEAKQSQSVLFAADEKEKARLELENVKRILKELYDRREKKIVTLALNRARTGVVLINTSNMLPPERLLFDAACSVLSEFRSSILFKLASFERPSTASISESIISKINGSAAVVQEKTVETLPEAPESGFEPPSEPKELKITPSFNDNGSKIRKIRFLAPIGEIVGPDLQIYGPYEEGETIELPVELARVLVEKRQAEMN
jgi:DNA replication initiation complex subunit (GINS family)